MLQDGKLQRRFARGYIGGLIYGAVLDPSPINQALDTWEAQDPLFAFQLSLAGGIPTFVFERAVRLIQEGRIPAFHLRNFTFWVGNTRVTNEHVLTAIDILSPYVMAGDTFCSDVLIDFLGARFHSGELPSLLSMNRELVWKSLSAYTDHPSRQSFYWSTILNSLIADDPNRAIKLACKALVGEEFELSDSAKGLLAAWASAYPREVMSGIGDVMLDEKRGVRFFVAKFPLFTAVPFDIVTSWLRQVGVEGARKIARHLPLPFLEADGQATVPELSCGEFVNGPESSTRARYRMRRCIGSGKTRLTPRAEMNCRVS